MKLIVRPMFEKRDAWIGLYWDYPKVIQGYSSCTSYVAYLCLVPFVPIKFTVLVNPRDVRGRMQIVKLLPMKMMVPSLPFTFQLDNDFLHGVVGYLTMQRNFRRKISARAAVSAGRAYVASERLTTARRREHERQDFAWR